MIEEINGIKFSHEGKNDSAIVQINFVNNHYQLEEDLTDKTVVDVGAHIGTYSILAALRGAKVIAFEPTTRTFDSLVNNVNMNKLVDKITCRHLAVGRPGMRKIYYDDEAGDGNKLDEMYQCDEYYAKYPFEIIETISLKDAVKDGCDILKLDCEGAEFEMLKDLIVLRIPQVIVEFHRDNIYGFLEDLRPYYKIENIGKFEYKLFLK